MWRKFRELNICATSSNNTIPDLLNVPDDINKAFSAFSTNTNSVDKNVINSYLNKTHPNLLHLFEFCSVTESTVKDSIINIKSSAAGVDEISLDMLLLCLNRILPFITNIINSCLLESQFFPDCWKIAKVIPLAKITNPTSFNDMRPISILSILSKILERIMCLQITDHLNQNNLFLASQSGFRKGYSCTTALLNVTDEIFRAIDKGETAVMVLLDYTKAFIQN